MRFLLDMGLSPRTAEWLGNAGHDAVHLRDQGLQRLSDSDIIGKAAKENRIILTFDLDFSRLLALLRLAQPSVVLFRLSAYTPAKIHPLMDDLIRRFGPPLEKGAIIVVDDDRVRVRMLPIW